MMKRLSGLVLLLCLANFLSAQDMRMDTYCNPLNIDYTYMIIIRIRVSPTVPVPILPWWSFGVNIICLSPVHTVIGVPGIC